jgi:hypothetical protein
MLQQPLNFCQGAPQEWEPVLPCVDASTLGVEQQEGCTLDVHIVDTSAHELHATLTT